MCPFICAACYNYYYYIVKKKVMSGSTNRLCSINAEADIIIFLQHQVFLEQSKSSPDIFESRRCRACGGADTFVTDQRNKSYRECVYSKRLYAQAVLNENERKMPN